MFRGIPAISSFFWLFSGAWSDNNRARDAAFLGGAGISPDQKDSSVCAPFAQSDTDSIRLRVAAGLPLGDGRGIKNNSRSNRPSSDVADVASLLVRSAAASALRATVEGSEEAKGLGKAAPRSVGAAAWGR